MYDTQEILSNLDRNMWLIIGLCGFAMLCNYAWFFTAVWQGFRDKTYPMPVFATLFWLSGDGSMVVRFEHWFNVIDHWYVKLFWAALCVTVASELVFVYMILRFGRKELAPSLSQTQFALAVLAAFVTFALAWEYIKGLIGDELYIDYFHLANLAGPIAGAMMVWRRGNRAGTNMFIWIGYTLMVGSWFMACALWYGGPFSSPFYLAIYALCTLSAAAMIFITARLPKAQAPPAAG